MLKFGFRNKNFYPLMLLLFIFLRICLDKILKFHPYKDNIDFIIPFLIFFSQSIIGYIIHLYYSKKNNQEESSKSIDVAPIRIGTIELISNKTYLSKDTDKKIIFLVILTSFFNFIGCIIRCDDVVNFGKKEENNSQLEIRVRGIQIIISSLLCYYTIRLSIYKHQKFSLVIISVFLIILIILELYIASNVLNKIIALFICSMSCLSRSFLDVTEKYLFDFNYINILLMMIYEGLIGIFLYIISFISNNSYQRQGINLINNIHFDWDLFSFLLLIILYIIISGFRNAYRVTTNKYYSPMSRALFESTLDPFLFLYNSLTFKRKNDYEGYWIYFSIVFFCLSIIAFFSLVYNDFIILYCCGLELDTYKEITDRLYSQQINRVSTVIDVNDNSSSSNIEEEEENDSNIEEEEYN